MVKNTGYSKKIVVFLGAGASQFIGYRTFQSFDTLILDSNVRNNENLPAIPEATVQLIKEIQTSLIRQRRPVTHDNYLWMLEYYHQFCKTFSSGDLIKARLQQQSGDLWGTIGPFGEQIKEAISDMIATTLHHYSQNRVRMSDHRTISAIREVALFYQKLASMNNHHAPYVAIFTTNYDMLLEDIFLDSALGFSSLPLVNGIPGVTAEQAAWRPEEYDIQGKSGIHLYRLHGCVCWLYHIYGSEAVYHHREDLLYQDLNSLCVMIPGREIHRGKKPHALGFRELYNHLRLCDAAVFIGFSFRDDDVMHLLMAANAARGEVPIKIIVVNPLMNPDRVKANLEEASTRSVFPVRIPALADIKHLPIRFGWDDNFADSIIEQLEKEIVI